MTSPNPIVLCTYRYDPLDRLASSSPLGQADVQRFYQKNRLATEIEGALQRTVFQHEDLILAQLRYADGVVDTTLLATDQQRSVLRLVDKSGIEPLAYSAYGHHPAESGLTSLLGFNGERCDPVTGHYLLGNGYRAYNPVLMRFNSPDSLSPFDEGGLNAYGYCEGDPVGFRDPSGHAPYNGLLRRALKKAYLKSGGERKKIPRGFLSARGKHSKAHRSMEDRPLPASPLASTNIPPPSMTSALQVSDKGRPSLAFPCMTWEYRVRKTKEFHHPIDTAVPADFYKAKTLLHLHYKRQVDVEKFIYFHNAKRAVSAEKSIAAGPLQFYENIQERDMYNYEVYLAGLSRRRNKATPSAIRNHR
ncbi:RHS repeat-associated core domain-containing protein [Pseudomonas sp. SZ57]|uniref:RHS repeat-associated core domain-containing protein n=1 Tax=Pseudomonas sp. SZ57 TaxID=2662259 RepID=UPI001290AEED|nr:RHS repeat-associated core domain-containing protein [Pseudomonas sp. SZ57]MQQ36505.1 RHS repeat-associated core domain-containing protein [Pseudomonas sp. SZ57]